MAPEIAEGKYISSNREKMTKYYIVSENSGIETREQGWKNIRKISNLLR